MRREGDTTTGQISRTDTISSQANGSLQIPIQGLSTDIALKIRLNTASLLLRAYLPVMTVR